MIHVAACTFSYRHLVVIRRCLRRPVSRWNHLLPSETHGGYFETMSTFPSSRRVFPTFEGATSEARSSLTDYVLSTPADTQRESRIPVPRRLTARRASGNDLPLRDVRDFDSPARHHSLPLYNEAESQSNTPARSLSRFKGSRSSTFTSQISDFEQTVCDIPEIPAQDTRGSQTAIDLLQMFPEFDDIDDTDSLLRPLETSRRSTPSVGDRFSNKPQTDVKSADNLTLTFLSSETQRSLPRGGTFRNIPRRRTLDSVIKQEAEPLRRSSAGPELLSSGVSSTLSSSSKSTPKRYGDLRHTPITPRTPQTSTLASFKKSREQRRQLLSRKHALTSSAGSSDSECRIAADFSQNKKQEPDFSEMDIAKKLNEHLAEYQTISEQDKRQKIDIGNQDSSIGSFLEHGADVPRYSENVKIAQKQPEDENIGNVGNASLTSFDQLPEISTRTSETQAQSLCEAGSFIKEHSSADEFSSSETLSLSGELKTDDSQPRHYEACSRFSMADLNLDSLERLSKSVGRRRSGRSSIGSSDYPLDTPTPTKQGATAPDSHK